jgi:uncharacterized protein (TIGR03435 family)
MKRHIRHIPSILVLAAAFVTALAYGQRTGLEFEVASIKPAVFPTPDKILSGQVRAGINNKGSQVDFGLMSLADLLSYAFRVRPYQIAGPDWMRQSRWDIVAKLPDGESPDHVPEMLKALLAERFKLAVHRENREQPVYELVAKGTLKLKPSDTEDDSPSPAATPENSSLPGLFGGGLRGGGGNIQINPGGRGMVVTGGPNGTMRMSPGTNGGMRLEMTKVTMPAFANMLTPFTDRTVIDRTELKGTYHVTLELPPEAMLSMMQNAARTAGIALPSTPFGARDAGTIGGPIAGAATDPSGSAIFEALQELGLKLQPAKAPVETIIVDQLERTPSEN